MLRKRPFEQGLIKVGGGGVGGQGGMVYGSSVVLIVDLGESIINTLSKIY
jgi:hypothetical protein